MEKLKNVKQMLMDGVIAQTSRGLQSVNPQELGEAIDMIKDIEEIIYYCSITKAMEEKEKENEFMQKHFSSMNYPMYYNGASQYASGGNSGNSGGGGGGSRNYDGEGRMYYNGGSSNYASGGGNSSGGNNARGGGSRGYSDGWSVYPIEMRDYREGRSPMTRRNYMEAKELHHDKAKQMQELEKYVQELTNDVLEMIEDASPEEKIALSQKMTTLANKIK